MFRGNKIMEPSCSLIDVHDVRTQGPAGEFNPQRADSSADVSTPFAYPPPLHLCRSPFSAAPAVREDLDYVSSIRLTSPLESRCLWTRTPNPNALLVRELFAHKKLGTILEQVNEAASASSSISSPNAQRVSASTHSCISKDTQSNSTETLPPIEIGRKRLESLLRGADARVKSRCALAFEEHMSTYAHPTENSWSAAIKRVHCKSSNCTLSAASDSYEPVSPPAASVTSKRLPPSPTAPVTWQKGSLEEQCLLQAKKEKEDLFMMSCKRVELLYQFHCLIQDERSKRLMLLGKFISCQYPLPCLCVEQLFLALEDPPSRALRCTKVTSTCLFVSTVLEQYGLLQNSLLTKRQTQLDDLRQRFEIGFFAYFSHQRIYQTEHECWDHLMRFHAFCMYVASLRTTPGAARWDRLRRERNRIGSRDSPFCSYSKFIEFSILTGGVELHEEVERKEIECEEARVMNRLIASISFGLQKALIEEAHVNMFRDILKWEAQERCYLLENTLLERQCLEVSGIVRLEKRDRLKLVNLELSELTRSVQEAKIEQMAFYELKLEAIYAEARRKRLDLELKARQRLSTEESATLAREWMLVRVIAENEGCEAYQRNLLVSMEAHDRTFIISVRNKVSNTLREREMYSCQEDLERGMLRVGMREHVERDEIIQRQSKEYKTLFLEKLLPLYRPFRPCDAGVPSPRSTSSSVGSGPEAWSFQTVLPNIMDLRHIILSDLHEFCGTTELGEIFSP